MPYDLTDVGGVVTTTGKLGNGILGDTGDCLYLNDPGGQIPLVVGDDFTVMFWYLPQNLTGSRNICAWTANNGAASLILKWDDTNNRFDLGGIPVGINVQVSANGKPTGSFLHFALTYDHNESTLQAYINGVAETPTTDQLTANTGSYFSIGGFYIASVPTVLSPLAATEKLDQFCYWKTVLTEAQIQAIYNNGTGLDYVGNEATFLSPLAVWDFEEATGETRVNSRQEVSNPLPEENQRRVLLVP